MIYGYARVSTLRQASGTSLDDQRQQLTEAGADEIFVDTFTGTTKDRPELNRMMAKVKAGDTVKVCKLDRLARSAQDGLALIDTILAKGAAIEVLNMGKFDNTAIGKLSRTVLLAFAEFERDQIVERMAAGKAAARERGQRVDGRPQKFDEKQIEHAMTLLESGVSYREVAHLTGISKSSLIRHHAKLKGGNPQ